jgi:hypothetical protein
MRKIKLKKLKKFIEKEKMKINKAEWRKMKKNYNSLPRPERNKI